MPSRVIKRAKVILKSIIDSNTDEIYNKPKRRQSGMQESQMSLNEIAYAEIINELKMMDVTTFTAIDSMNKLYELSMKAKEI